MMGLHDEILWEPLHTLSYCGEFKLCSEETHVYPTSLISDPLKTLVCCPFCQADLELQGLGFSVLSPASVGLPRESEV